MPITIYPGTVKKRNANGTYSDLVPGADANTQLAGDIAEEYDSTSGVYSVGDYCLYQSVLYKCITAISTPEAFNSSKWTYVSVTDEIGIIRNTIPAVIDSLSSASTTNALSAAQGKALRDLINAKIHTFSSIVTGTTKSYTVEAGTNAVFLTVGQSDTRMSIVLLTVGSQGNTFLVPVLPGSNIAYDTTTNYALKVTSSGGTSYPFAIIFTGSITQ